MKWFFFATTVALAGAAAALVVVVAAAVVVATAANVFNNGHRFYNWFRHFFHTNWLRFITLQIFFRK
jgi:hypothetical protein